MPKKQSTAAKKARAAARQGAKFTKVLRESGERDVTAPEASELVLASLADLVARGEQLPVTVVPPVNPAPRPSYAMKERWGIVEAVADGYVVRETNEWHTPHTLPGGGRRPRVPVPYLTADGGVAVVELPPVAWCGEKSLHRWVFAHNGWAIDAPGQPADCASVFAPSFEMPFQVSYFNLRNGVMGEDYVGGPAYWGTSAWCPSLERARQLAEALVHWDGEAARVQVWEHDRHVLNDPPVLVLQQDAADVRPPMPYRSAGPVTGRPQDPSEDVTAEPQWAGWAKENERPRYALHVWEELDGWGTIGWFSSRSAANVAAARLLVAVDGMTWRFGMISGPNYPGSAAHDWTQDGRTVVDYLPDITVPEYQLMNAHQVVGGAADRRDHGA